MDTIGQVVFRVLRVEGCTWVSLGVSRGPRRYKHLGLGTHSLGGGTLRLRPEEQRVRAS